MSEQRAALVDGDGRVANVIVLDTDAVYEPADGLQLTVLDADSRVGPGWTYEAGAGFKEPPSRSLNVDRDSIPGDGVTAAVVTYSDTYDDAPETVTFTANGATQVVTLTSAGNAFLDVVSSTPGDTVTVTVDALPGSPVTIAVEEV